MSSTVTILYKSGAKVYVECDDLAVRKNGAEITSMTWTGMEPHPLHIGVGEIAAVFEGKA